MNFRFRLLLLLVVLATTSAIAEAQPADDEDSLDILDWFEEVQEIAETAKIPCTKTPPIPIFYREEGVSGPEFRYGATQWPTQVRKEDCPPKEPPIPIFYTDPEAVRKTIEDFRLGLEHFREQIELQRRAGDLPEEIYEDAIPSYKVGMSIYHDSIREYRMLIELKNSPVQPEGQRQ